MKKLALSLVAVAAMSTTVYAGGDVAPVVPMVDDSGFYAGLGYSYMSLRDDEGGELTGNGVLFLAGYQFNRYFAVEGRYATTVGDLSVDGGGDLDAELSNIGIYLKPMYTMDKLTLYALLGYGEITLQPPGGAPEGSESGFQWGLGASYAVTEDISVNVDYMQYYNGTGFAGDPGDYTADAFSVSLTYRF